MIDDQIIRQLADPQRFPGGVGTVVQFQTHLSLVCVVGDRAYKLKKSLRLPFVDFSSMENRRQFCEEEARLNARLCPDVYLGVIPLFQNSGEVSFCDVGGGEIIDYAVLMRRLPAEKMLDVLLAQDAVTTTSIEHIAELMADFHQGVVLAGDCDDAIGAGDRLRQFALANFDETADQCGTIFDADLHQALRDQSVLDFERHLPVLRKRAQAGRVVDGHGDLHARNICLCKPPAIYDCLEFNRELRIGDVAAENAFLIMDLRYRGHVGLAAAYLDRYIAATGDREQRALMPMLLRHRAMVRAKVAALASGESEISARDREGLVGSARRHMALMAASVIEEGDPWLICACGLPASGKSYVFGALARATGWPCLASDVIRKQLAGLAPTDRAPQTCYTAEASDQTYAELLRRATLALGDGPVLVDANFGTAALRARAVECARSCGAQIAFVWFHADESIVARRMRQRAEDKDDASDADLEVYSKLLPEFEPPSENCGTRIVRAEDSGDLDQRVAAVLRSLMDCP